MGHSARKQAAPDLGILAVDLLRRVQGELFATLAVQGFTDISPRHGGVLAYLDEEGVRLSDLAQITGRNKQTVAAIVDELENLGYLARTTDPSDRRARLIVPTEHGHRLLQVADTTMTELEERRAQALGVEAYDHFKRTLALMARGDSGPSDTED